MYIPFSQCKEISKQNFETVLHIGAHHGEEAIQYVQNGVKEIIWVEANKKLMAQLFDKTVMFPVNQYYVNQCLSDVDKEQIEFHISNNGQSSSILELGTHSTMYPHIQYVDKVSMTARRLDDLAKEATSGKYVPYEKVDFVNLDVQGAELKVLTGFGVLLEKQYGIKAIYTEVNLEHVYKDCCLVNEIDDYLSLYSFRRAATACPEKTWGDALYVRV
jgi:FkbM family methyltransferase